MTLQPEQLHEIVRRAVVAERERCAKCECGQPDKQDVHQTIWLQPWCDDCARNCNPENGGRQWCQDEVWGACEECGLKPVKYVLADDEAGK
jgi:hypothetical protein